MLHWNNLFSNGHIQIENVEGSFPKFGDWCLVECTGYSEGLPDTTGQQNGNNFVFWMKLGHRTYSESFERIISSLTVGAVCEVSSSDGQYRLGIRLREIISGEGASLETTNVDTLLERVQKWKEEGKKYVQQASAGQEESICLAIKKYESALELVVSSGNKDNMEKQQKDNLVTSLHSNLAICYNRIRQSYMAWFHSSAALRINQSDRKAIFQRAKAYLRLKDYVNAYKDVTALYSNEFEDSSIIRLKQEIEQCIDRQCKEERREIIDCFGKEIRTRMFYTATAECQRKEQDG